MEVTSSVVGSMCRSAPVESSHTAPLTHGHRGAVDALDALDDARHIVRRSVDAVEPCLREARDPRGALAGGDVVRLSLHVDRVDDLVRRGIDAVTVLES